MRLTLGTSVWDIFLYNFLEMFFKAFLYKKGFKFRNHQTKPPIKGYAIPLHVEVFMLRSDSGSCMSCNQLLRGTGAAGTCEEACFRVAKPISSHGLDLDRLAIPAQCR